MSLDQANINSLWAGLIVEELVRHDITRFVVSPGSRSAPLTVAAARNDRAEVLMHFDERGAAYYALGTVRGGGHPAALICTSGTATANYFPAVIEAAQDGEPLIILTADRPAELRDSGANQTIDQVRLYGDYPVWQMDLPCPTVSIDPEVVLGWIGQAAARANGVPPGPVHLNCQFREPLAPIDTHKDFEAYLSGPVSEWLETSQPFTPAVRPNLEPAEELIDACARRISPDTRGLIVVGAMHDADIAPAVFALAGKLNWPVLADIRSGLRLGQREPALVAHVDQLLTSESFAEAAAPEVVIHFGGSFVSKRLLQFLAQATPGTYVHVSAEPRTQDPERLVTLKVHAAVDNFCRALTARVEASSSGNWLSSFATAESAAVQAIEQRLAAHPLLSEPWLAHRLSVELTEGHGLFLGNSLPIRAMDMFASAGGSPLRVAANRGASGIDGGIASAAGFAAGLRRPVTALIGDLAFLHDLNSLALLARAEYPVRLVVVNNDGGAIFSFLPIAGFGDVFEEHFRTPHGLCFEHAAAQFGLPYYHVTSPDEFLESWPMAANSAESSILEVSVDPAATLSAFRSIEQVIAELLG